MAWVYSCCKIKNAPRGVEKTKYGTLLITAFCKGQKLDTDPIIKTANRARSYGAESCNEILVTHGIPVNRGKEDSEFRSLDIVYTCQYFKSDSETFS